MGAEKKVVRAPTPSLDAPEWLRRVARKFGAGRTLSGSKAKLKPTLDEGALLGIEETLGAMGRFAAQVTFSDENEGARVGIGSFAKFYEDWLDESWLGDALAKAVESAIEKKRPLKPEHHALVIEFAAVFERNGGGIFAAIPRAMLAFYMSDRVMAKRLYEELRRSRRIHRA